MNKIIWLFPILFMIHDFEEIILIKKWKNKYNSYFLNNEIKRVPFGEIESTALFSVAVAEEFIIFSIVTYVASLTNFYLIWYAFFIAFFVHLIIHSIIPIIYKIYIPGFITSVFFIIPSYFLLIKSIKLLNYSVFKFIFSGILGLLILLLNLKILHKFLPHIGKKWFK